MGQLDRLSKISIIVVGAIALFAALDALEGIFAPLALALVTGVVLSPLSDFWESRGYPTVIGALLGLIATLAVIAGLTLVFQPVIAQLVDQAPKVWSDMQETIRTIRSLLRGLADVTDDIGKAVSPEAGAATNDAKPAAEGMAMPTVADAVMVAPAVLSQLLIFAGTLFFFVLTRTEIYDWAALRLSERGERAQTALKLRRAERQVSRYFLTITMINAGLGAATAVALQMLGMPGAMLWGVVGFLLNFIVYLGPAIFVVTLLFAGVAVFDGWLAVGPALSFVALNAIEGQFVTPALVGRHLRVNPLLVFLALVFGIWLWGPIGGIVAIPLLLWILVLNDAVAPAATPLSEEAAGQS
ncbi:MAG: AI-2E family transporter [Paracoccaceae bacterium]